MFGRGSKQALSMNPEVIAASPELAGSRRRTNRKGIVWRLVFGLAIFTSAFLLFQVQLVLGKFLLPWFGGTSAIWATCLLFFQLLLLGGYVYAHQISSSYSLRGQGKIHLALIGVSVAWILVAWSQWGSAILPSVAWKPAPEAAPVLGILKLLLLSVGLPFLLLSTTGPLLQAWYARLNLGGRHDPPYFLYALSNVGSLLGLLSYPLALEPIYRLKTQSHLWGAGFIFFAIFCAVCAWEAHRSKLGPETSPPAEDDRAPAATDTAPTRRWLWFMLPMAASAMLLATTNLLTQDVAPIPLLWVLPLCVYLLSFVLTFHGTWYRRAVFHPLFALTAMLGILALFQGSQLPIILQIAVYLALLFAACMVCHGELARIKPAARYLTAFYLLLSAGGAAGGLFVAIIAPMIFPTFIEYHIALYAIAALLVIALVLDKQSWLHEPKPDLLIPLAAFTFVFAIPKFLAWIGMTRIPRRATFPYNMVLVGLLGICVWLAFTGGPKWARRRKFRWYEVTLGAIFLLLSAGLYRQLSFQDKYLLLRERNFYGALAVYEVWDKEMLNSAYEFLHGRVTHGVQVKKNRKLPASYYGEKTGAHLALTTHPRRAIGPMRVGAVGLGIGTVAAFSRPGDVYRFYELNPAVIRLAQGEGGYFTYLNDAPARIEIVPGDARLSLEAEAARHEFQNFDVLFLDAFNGDSVPVHLLTREAMALYLSHLRGPDSVIVVNITNFAIDLSPVVATLAETYGMKASLIQSELNTGVFLPSAFVLLTKGNSLDVPQIRQVGRPIGAPAKTGTADGQLWTDDYSNVVSVLRRR
jgi:spermidine synthase